MKKKKKARREKISLSSVVKDRISTEGVWSGLRTLPYFSVTFLKDFS
jgi:hypothetical protein